MSKLGLVYVFTGEGKGKTSAAIGTAVRAVGTGMKVAWVSWYKQDSWQLAETTVLKQLGVETYLLGKGFNLKGQGEMPVAAGGRVVDTASESEHKWAAEKALKKAGELIGKVDLLILDEVNNAVEDKLIDPIDLIDLISNRKQTHIILTGRNAKPELVEIADLVTEMKKVKHPYDKGKLAVRGLDF